MHKLSDVPLKQIMIEHYLFDLDQSVEKTAEIFGMDKKRVKEIYENYKQTFGVKGKTE